MDEKALQDEFNGLVKEVKEFQTAWAGKSAPRDDMNAMLAKADRMDQITKDLEAFTEQKSLNDRLARHMGTATQGTGHVPLNVTTGSNPDAALGEEKDGWIGIQTKSGWKPMYHKEFVAKRPDIAISFQPEYRRVFGQYLRGYEKHLEPAEKRLLDQGGEMARKALSESSNVGGGFAVPVDFVPEVIMRLPGQTQFTDRARHITTNRDQIAAPRIAANTGSFPTMYSSAVVATWVSENPAASTGQVAPVFESVPITVNTAKLETILSKNLVQDAAFNVGAYLTEEFQIAASLLKDQAFLVGTGLAQPLGVAKDSDITSINSAVAATVSADDVKELRYRTAVQYQTGSEYWLSLDCLRKLREMKDGNGNYIWSPGFNHGVEGGVPSTLEGAPYNVTDFLDTAGTTANVPMFYGNPRFYWVVDRLDMSIQVLNELYAESNQIAYLAFFRVGGHVVVPQAFRVLTLS